MEKNMSKKLTLLAFVAITVFGSTSVYADTHTTCRNMLSSGSKKPLTVPQIDARCKCVVDKGTDDNREHIMGAIKACVASHNNPHS